MCLSLSDLPERFEMFEPLKCMNDSDYLECVKYLMCLNLSDLPEMSEMFEPLKCMNGSDCLE